MKKRDTSFKQKLYKLFDSRLFIISLTAYILIPLVAILVYKANISSRTSGVYVHYEGGQITSKIVLTQDNKVQIVFYDDRDCKTDHDYVYRNVINSWTYRSCAWKDNYDPEKYKYLSTELIRFGDDKSESRFIYFKIGTSLYSDFLMDESRGGGQKCYTKI